MKIAYLFPGQGSQKIGMGKELYEEYEEVKEIYKLVKEITGIDIAKISFEGPEEILNETKYTQLAIITMSLGILEILNKQGIEPEMSAGLSLGEYGALVASKALTKEDAIKLIEKRGEYMQNMLPKGNWKMAAILGLDENTVIELCKSITNYFVVPANFNTKEQIVISGEEEGIIEAENKAKELGAKKVRILNTAGPFHTEKLKLSSIALRKELDKIEFKKFKSKVIKNIDGTEYKENDNIREILEKHIISPVKFSKTIQTMLNYGIDTFIEIGPGRSLSSFVKREKGEKEINILNINNVDTLKETIKFINENQ